MTKFIKLTERYNNKEIPMLINVDCISIMKLGNGGVDTMLQIRNEGENKYYFVKENIEEIWRRINYDSTLAPIIMTADEALKYYKDRDGC